MCSFRPILVAFLLVSARARAAPLYRGGVVATQHPDATRAAVAMLDAGGNAADAAAAAAFALAVVGPYDSGIGGGGFALVHRAEKNQTQVLDFRELAPAAAHREMFLKDGQVVPGLSTDGGLAVAVPAAVKGYLELQRTHGKLSRQKVLAPAIRLARQGFWVGPKYWARAQARLACLQKDPESARLFLRKGGSGTPEVPAIGTVLRQPELAKTLEAISRQGEAAFYTGPVARAIAATVQAAGGILTAEDLAAVKVRWREPLATSYRGHRIVTMPPPSAGGLAIVQVLGMMERLRPEALRHRDAETLHLFVEAIRRVYVDRAKHLGDPDQIQVPIAQLTSADYIEQLARSIDPARATSSQSLLPVQGSGTALSPVIAPPVKNTSHLSVIDRAGDAVALTTTVNYAWGACLTAKGTGVLLNDQMDDFAAKPMTPNVYGLITGEGNAVAPGKIPLSSMSPTLVFQKADPRKMMLAVGSPGGSTIPTSVVQVVSNVIDHQMDLTRAVSAGRVHHQYLPDVLVAERLALEPATRAALEAKGHNVSFTEALGNVEAVMVDPVNGLRSAASDPRGEGAGLGQD